MKNIARNQVVVHLTPLLWQLLPWWQVSVNPDAFHFDGSFLCFNVQIYRDRS